VLESITSGIADAVDSALGPTAGFLERYVWAWPQSVPLLAVLLLGTALFVTLRLAFIQVRGFRHAIDIARGKYDDPEDEGDLEHFPALTAALSATVGAGSIAGVAIAVRLGGPGALFWMWLAGFLGMALKYAECTLAVLYRKINPDGSVSGGPMYYIERGMGARWKWMALAFAACAAISSFGGGCMNQSHTLADQVQAQFGVSPAVTGLTFASLVGFVILGGIRRIGEVTAVLAPSMAVLYVAGALLVLLLDLGDVPGALMLIVTQAFAPEPLVGGGVGSLLLTAMWGMRRGLFSSEAGQGSAPMAHATAKTGEPVRQGLVSLLEPFIDTLVICTMTGLVIVTTGAYRDKVPQTLPLAAVEAVPARVTDPGLLEARLSRTALGDTTVRVEGGRVTNATLFFHDSTVDEGRVLSADGIPWTGNLLIRASDGALAVPGDGRQPDVQGIALLDGAPLTALAFRKGLGGFGGLIVTLSVVLFAVSAGISWSYYGDRAVEYLFGPAGIPVYRWVFILFFFFGAILPLRAVWTYGDVALGLMTLPNVIAVLALAGVVTNMTREYFSRRHAPYR
jgi:AGCS family alanine or glycine:cation symporter